MCECENSLFRNMTHNHYGRNPSNDPCNYESNDNLYHTQYLTDKENFVNNHDGDKAFIEMAFMNLAASRTDENIRKQFYEKLKNGEIKCNRHMK